MHRNHIVDGHGAARPGEGNTHFWIGGGSARRADIRGVLDVEERWNLRLIDQPHRVLIEQAVALNGGRRAEGSATDVNDVIAVEHRCVRIEEKTPMGAITSEQRGRLPAVVVAEHQRRQAAVTNFLPHHGDRRVLAQKLLEGIVRYFASASMSHTLCSDPALANSRELSNTGMLMPWIWA
ncbi:MAG: hypothetical protein ABW318_03255 [Vicinamibacterales bacterium]